MSEPLSLAVLVSVACQSLMKTPWETLKPTNVEAPVKKLRALRVLVDCEPTPSLQRVLHDTLLHHQALSGFWGSSLNELLPKSSEEAVLSEGSEGEGQTDEFNVVQIPEAIAKSMDYSCLPLREIMLFWPKQLYLITLHAKQNQAPVVHRLVAAVFAQMLCELMEMERHHIRELAVSSHVIKSLFLGLGLFGGPGHLVLLEEFGREYSAFFDKESNLYISKDNFQEVWERAQKQLKERTQGLLREELQAQRRRVQSAMEVVHGLPHGSLQGQLSFAEDVNHPLMGGVSLLESEKEGGLSLQHTSTPSSKK